MSCSVRALDAWLGEHDLRDAAEMCTHTPGAHRIDVDEALTFLRHYYKHVAPEDVIDRNPVDVYGPAMAHRQLAAHRPPGPHRR